MGPRISIIVPNWNGAATIGTCLKAIFNSKHDSFEVIVVDDCSSDDSVEIAKLYPCQLIQFSHRQGAASARNAGAVQAQGEILFFTDADCVILEDTLLRVEETFRRRGPDVIVGGTYTSTPYDKSFFSFFQSVFVQYSEIKSSDNPDYVATHVMALSAKIFKMSNGFSEDFYLPILEDVEYSHRLLGSGCRLVIDPELQVRHIFNFSLKKSIKNAFRKSKYWTIYSLVNQDLLKDSGCASWELKINFISLVVTLLLLFVSQRHSELISPVIVVLPTLINVSVSRNLLKRFYQTGGVKMVLKASAYYMFVYSAVVGVGGFWGLVTSHMFRRQKPLVYDRSLLHNLES